MIRSLDTITAVTVPVMQLQTITKRYGSVTALADVSIEFQPGVVHAIVGENGAGKSTLINVASGVVAPTLGSIRMDGQEIEAGTPATMRRRGIAVVHQHPALAVGLTVRENLALGVDGGLPSRAKVSGILADVAKDGMAIDPDDRLSDLGIAQWHVVEIAKALLLEPKILILDEPTEPFGRGEVERLFGLIRGLAKRGVAVVYISHRLQEVLSIADVVTVLRDGRLIATMPRAAVEEADIIAKIAGRTMDRLFPEKTEVRGPVRLSAKSVSGVGFHNISLDLPAGCIVGLAGIEGHGQRSFLRALAGLETLLGGELRCDGRLLMGYDRYHAVERGIGFITDHRQAEGLFKPLPLSDNLNVLVLAELTRNWLISPRQEAAAATAAVARFGIKTAGIQANPTQLSGGNQQKLLFARELAARPKVLIVDEPTKGVDVGARFDIYMALRRLCAEGTAVLVLCSDALELQGLCDIVHVFSNGTVVETLQGERVTETNIAAAMIGGTDSKSDGATAKRSTPWRRFLKGDLFPILPVGLVTVAIMATAAWANPFYLTGTNLAAMASLLAVLAFVALGQACVFAIGGIDLSSGPLAGLMVVLASFLIANDGGSIPLGIAALLAAASAVGLLHAVTILVVRLPPIVVTLASFVAIGGFSLLLRPEPAGTIDFDYMDAIAAPVFGVPLGLALALVAAIALAAISSFSKFGRRMRAWGSDAHVARRLGVGEIGVTIAAYTASAFLSGVAGLLLAAQIGTGSAATGTDYTLSGITAFVISGASVAGGRLSFVAVLVAALLVQVTLNVTTFLNLNTAWQYWLVGVATILGAAIFSQLRGKTRAH
ncbi:MAG: ATP-binding cassette domain-containing protein [Ancalomicrobiaceae bacterium]|nr:ATP-binding cassette domain-containing protein [Ancalomicrobiaceae bacterium]